MIEFTKPSREVDRVFLHCSASDNPSHDDVEVMRRWHVEGKGWSDVGYHLFVKKNGTVQEGRPLSKIPAAQVGHNTGTIAICCHGLEVSKFTRAQYVALADLCEQIKRAYAGEVTFHGHCEVSPKSCPVYPYKCILGLDEEGCMRLATNVDPTPDERESSQDLPTLRVFARGEAVRVLQGFLNRHGQDLAVDGIFGQATLAAVKDFQETNRLGVDGIVGPKTWAALSA